MDEDTRETNALGVMEAAHQLKIRIPDDLSVAGFDDIAMASFGRIALTTIHLPKTDMGRAAAELLVRKIAAPEAASRREIIFPTRLVIRGSTGPAARPARQS